MDRRAVVDPPETAVATARADQAIFTSIPSPMGRGYRVIAASAGLTAEEKQEIVRSAPSHGAMCDDAPNARALASFILRSGRQCIFISRNAGVEHTARGGARIHTHVLLLEPAAFAAFHHDPLAVQSAADLALDPRWVEEPPTRLDTLTLVVATGHSASASPGESDVIRLLPVAAAVLTENRCIAVGAANPATLARRLLDATPAAFRKALSLSYGLKLSPARAFQIIFTEAGPGDIERAKSSAPATVLDWAAPPPDSTSEFDPWLSFVARRWQLGDHEDVRILSDHLTEERAPHALASIATLCDDREQLEHADSDQLDKLIQKHAHATPVSDLHTRLLSEFRQAADNRRAALDSAADEDPQTVSADARPATND